MRKFAHLKKSTVSLTLGALLALSVVATAFAAETDISTTVDAGVLTSSITTPPVFATVTYSHDTQESESTTDLEIQVDDATGTGAGWFVSLASTELTYTGGNTGSPAIPASQVAVVTANAPTSSAGHDTTGITVGTAGSLDAGRNILVAPAQSGEGTYEQTVDLQITIPAQAAAGSYTGTLTLTHNSGPVV